VIPPATTDVLAAALLQEPEDLGEQHVVAPDRIDRPTTSTSSWIAAAATCRESGGGPSR
jgi:hypothetical protein